MSDARRRGFAEWVYNGDRLRALYERYAPDLERLRNQRALAVLTRLRQQPASGTQVSGSLVLTHEQIRFAPSTHPQGRLLDPLIDALWDERRAAVRSALNWALPLVDVPACRVFGGWSRGYLLVGDGGRQEQVLVGWPERWRTSIEEARRAALAPPGGLPPNGALSPAENPARGSARRGLSRTEQPPGETGS